MLILGYPVQIYSEKLYLKQVFILAEIFIGVAVVVVFCFNSHHISELFHQPELNDFIEALSVAFITSQGQNFRDLLKENGRLR
ncbi:hypothetical protein COO59_15430 [Mixta theicola]|uniref:Uncharacterized protein n=1 Tax=Mixta theicola TaxID=1458355 RepID=A0A2K1Q6S4_9GAMM|nr:hypothetical protein COO59_15430 [Mixta theicola]